MNPGRPIGLTLFASPAITGEAGMLVTGRAIQRHRLALLALLARFTERGLSRDKLMAYLWPERDREHARQLLNQAVYTLRKALGDETILSAGDALRLNDRAVSCDVVEFDEALAAGAMDRAVALYSGPFLDGFFLPEAAEFERWAEMERQRLAAGYSKALDSLARAAEKRADFGMAVEWWRMSAAQDPYASRIALRLMLALDANGERAAALQHAAVHQRLLQDEFGMGPDPEVSALADRLRAEPGTGREVVREGTLEAADRLVRPPLRPTRPPDTAPLVEPEHPAPEESSASSPLGSPESPNDRSSSPPVAPAAAPPRRRRALRYGIVILAVGALVLGPGQWVTFRGEGPSTGEVEPSIARTPPDAGSDPSVAPWNVRQEFGGGVDSLSRQRTENVAAYELYVRGNDPALLRSDSTARIGLELLRQAVSQDPSFAAAWAGISRMYLRLSTAAPASDGQRYFALGEEAALRALELNANLGEAHGVIGAIYMNAFDFASAERHLKYAIELETTSAVYHEWLVTLYLWTERPAEAMAHARRALEIDPLSPSAHAEAARALLASDRCDEAFTHLDRLAGLQPPLLRAAPIAAQCHARQELWSEAIAVLRSHVERAGPTALAQLGYMLARDGQREEALAIGTTVMERWRSGEGGAFDVALVHVGLGALDEAFDWFDRSLDDLSLNGGPGHKSSMIVGPLFDPLRDDPRYARLLERLRLPAR